MTLEQAAHATERPIVLYDVPHRTGVAIAPDTVARLIECGNIVAIKECVKGHFDKLSALPIDVLCGTDEALDNCLHHGGTGGIPASAHVCADLLVAYQELRAAEREVDARNLFASLLPVLRLLFAAPNPSAIKAMLAFDHSLSDETRMPILRASAQLVDRLSTARDRLQNLRAELASMMN
ncbi:dihydrodipicolinate synthase family protein (plasmid) [Burkholderia sp. M6-3]